MGYEIERKWLVGEIPDDILQKMNSEEFRHTRILQGYLSTDPVVRVRKDGDEYWLTCKGSGALSREELNLPMKEEAFRKLLDKADGYILEKERYRIPDGFGLTIELDIFHGSYEGLIYAEVEFPDEAAAAAYSVPGWFGRELTHEKGWSNASLSLAKPRALC
jgi:CYTH domain-containing protein